MQQYRPTKWFVHMVSLSISTRIRAIWKTFSEACWKLSNIYNGAFRKNPPKKSPILDCWDSYEYTPVFPRDFPISHITLTNAKN